MIFRLYKQKNKNTQDSVKMYRILGVFIVFKVFEKMKINIIRVVKKINETVLGGKEMKRRAVAMLMAAIMTVSLSACGNSSGITEGASNAAEEVKTTDNTTEAEPGSKENVQEETEEDITETQDNGQAKSEKGEDSKLSVMVTWSDDGDVVARTGNELLEKLQEKYPDLELSVEVVAHDLYEDKLKTLMATNSLPDIFQSLPGLMPSMYDNEQIMDLAPEIAADSEWSGRMDEGAFNDYTFDDQILGVPQSMIVSSMMIYNKAIFEECGIKEFPKTVEDFEEAVTAIKDKGYIPLACGNKEGYMISSQIMPSILFRYADLDWYDSLKNGQGAKFTDPCMVAAITELKKLTDMGLFNEDVNSQEELLGNSYYYDGKAAMLMGGYWVTGNVVKNASDEVLKNSDTAMFPPTSEKPGNGKYMSGGQGWGVAVNSRLEGAEKEIAIDFVKSLSDPDIQAKIAGEGSIPCAKTSEIDNSSQSDLEKAMFKMFEGYEVVPNPEIQFNATYVSTAEDGYQELTIGSLTPEQLSEKLQSAYEEGQQ